MVPSAAGSYDAAHVFQRAGTWAGEGGLSRFVGGLFGRRDAGPPEPDKFNLLVLAGGTLHLVGCAPRGGNWAPRKPIGQWPTSDLLITAREDAVQQRAGSDGDFRGWVHTVQLEIEIESEARSISLEGTLWPGDDSMTETVEALLAATGGGEITSPWDDPVPPEG
jgi:hypothetical protein